MKSSITAIIIASNAESTIEACIKALDFCDRIIIGENKSTDRTPERILRTKAEMQSVVWEGYGKTKNNLISQVSTGWILSIDSDELVTPELASEIKAVVSQSDQKKMAGYWIARRNYFLEQRINHCGWNPDWQLRLFRAGTGKFEECSVHEAVRLSGETARLFQVLEHYSYQSLSDYFFRLNKYTTLAARDRVEKGRRFSFLRLVFDPGWTFVKMYFLKRGWLDKFPGFVLCVLSALNTLVKHAKHWEFQQKRKKNR